MRRLPAPIVLVAGLVACANPTQAPTGVSGTLPPPPAPGPLPPAPTITGPAVRYDRRSPSAIGWTDAYLLSEGADSTFLIIGPLGQTFWAFAGRYERADSVLTFRFNGWNSPGPWRAEGTLRGDSLIVRYDDVMRGSDFEDGVYVRPTRTSPGQE